MADELEEGYRGEIWNPARGHVQRQRQGIEAARLELRSLINETKVHVLTLLRLECDQLSWEKSLSLQTETNIVREISPIC